ncbi:probable G-protein coupled receptor Mth-like 1, partial [Sitophilus oryzae]|uniref:Probable G-protein coupled receptor Mth-like 1 n=1 Tax=Sitophilus oryzae TaxID=7048 RepID=A0A6J2YYX4_SITOR
MTTVFRKLLYLELVCLVFLLFSGRVKAAKKNVTIGKCCALDEILTYEQKCIKSYNSSWNLNVFYNGSLTPYKGKLPPKWVLKENFQPKCAKPVIDALSNRRFVPNMLGVALLVEYDQKITPSQYCIDYNYSLFCPNNSPDGEPSVLVKKCCGTDWIYSEREAKCISWKNSSYNIEVGPNTNLGIGFPICTGTNQVVAGKINQGQVLPNGTLWMNSSGVSIPAGNFCLEFILEQLDESASIITCQNYLPPVILPTSDEHDGLKFTIYPIGLAISAIFLAATLAAGSLLPASHHVLHWRCQTNYVACLLVGYVLLCITQVVGTTLTYSPCFII